jgi:hypothetical protein
MAKERALVGSRVVVMWVRAVKAYGASLPPDLSARRDAVRVRSYLDVIRAHGSWRGAERARFEIAIARGRSRNVGEVAGRR